MKTIKILCLLRMHYKDFETDIIEKDDNFEAGNTREFCKHCDWKGEWSGYTSFEFPEIKIKKTKPCKTYQTQKN